MNNVTNKKQRSRPSLSEKEVDHLSDGHHTCIVCFSSLGTNIRAKLPCQHDDICGICHLRLRFLNEDENCPICKQKNDTIIVDRDPDRKFSDYPRWGDEIGAGYIYRANVGMFFEETYFHESIAPLFTLCCHKCDFKIDENVNKNIGGKKKNKPRRLLEDHLRTQHRLSMCHLCIDHKRDFISQLPKFSPNQLQKHMKVGDGPGSGFSGHPICEFCHPKRFYDVNFLHQHLHKEHYKCHVCEKQGLDNQWFKNYRSMARHFDKQHFMCHDVQCLDARFVVFENELDLRAHEISVHGGSSTGSTKINLEFNIRRANGIQGERQDAPTESDFNYNLDGQSFVPQALPSSNDNNNSSSNSVNNRNDAAAHASQLHPQHVQRTEEFRAHAVTVRQQQTIESQVDSFPTLQSAATSSSAAPFVGWTSETMLQDAAARSNRNMGRVTPESFPALRSGSSNDRKKKATKGGIAARTRQFAAMTTSANQQQQQTSWGKDDLSTPVIGSMAPSSTATNFASTTSAITQRLSNLEPDNFPSLGGSSSVNNNRSANSLPKKNFGRRIVASAPPPSMNSASDFPSMQSINRNAATSSSGKGIQKNPHKPSQLPFKHIVSDFPAPSANRSSNTSSSEKSTKKNPHKPSQLPFKHSVSDFPPPSANRSSNSMSTQLGRNNVLPADISSTTSAKATVEDMKESLGQKNFKQLKQLTIYFAQDQLSPEGYVEQAAALFSRSYGDPDFWSYLPSLLLSCPNQDSSQHALKYMNSLQQSSSMKSTRRASAVAAVNSTTKQSSQWEGASGNKSNVMRQVILPPPLPASYTAARLSTQPVIVPGRSNMIASKKKNGWGGTPLARSLSAAQQEGSATKYMAKQEKMQKQKQSNNSSPQQTNTKKNGTKKKKPKNELKDLAYGR